MKNNTPNYDLTWYARGGQQLTCEDTAYLGGIYADRHLGCRKDLKPE